LRLGAGDSIRHEEDHNGAFGLCLVQRMREAKILAALIPVGRSIQDKERLCGNHAHCKYQPQRH
jgi:hypothetical protein